MGVLKLLMITFPATVVRDSLSNIYRPCIVVVDDIAQAPISSVRFVMIIRLRDTRALGVTIKKQANSS